MVEVELVMPIPDVVIHGAHVQVGKTVSIDVYNTYPGLKIRTSGCGEVSLGEIPIPLVKIERIGALITYKVDVFKPVAVKIGHSNSCSIVEVEVVHNILPVVFLQYVGKVNSRCLANFFKQGVFFGR